MDIRIVQISKEPVVVEGASGLGDAAAYLFGLASFLDLQDVAQDVPTIFAHVLLEQSHHMHSE